MQPKAGIQVALPAAGKVRDLVEHRELAASPLRLDMGPGELRSFLVRPE